MNWKEQAKLLFNEPKPEHFTNYNHCDECFEHDETLRAADVDSIDLDELGNDGWDPLRFSSVEGLIYYMPAMIRLTLETIGNFRERYLDKFLSKLILDGKDNRLVTACGAAQREFITSFLEYLIEHNAADIDDSMCSWDVLRAYEIWSKI